MPLNKKTFGIIAISVTLGVSIFWMMGEPLQAAENAAPPSRPLAQVKTQQLVSENVVITTQVPGRTVAYQIAEIRPQVSGIIVERMFTEGSYIEKGTQLYQIDPAPYKAAYEKALADLNKAKAHLSSVEVKKKRTADLFKNKLTSQQSFDDVETELAEALADIEITKASLSQTKISLDYTQVYAPIAGYIGKSLVTQGALVNANQVNLLTTITQLDPIYADVSLSSDQLMQLKTTMKAQENTPVKLNYLVDTHSIEFVGKLKFHEYSVEQSTGTIQARAVFNNPDKLLLPGMFVLVDLGFTKDNTILIPQKLVQRQANGSMSVWLVDNENKVQQVSIEATKTVDGNWLVESGLKAGDLLVVEGFMNLAPGQMVNVISAESNARNHQPKGN